MKQFVLNKKEDDFRKRLKHIHFQATMEGILPTNAKTNIVLSHDVGTASWSYLPPHKISIGLNKTNLKQNEYTLTSIFYHEVAHGLFTHNNKKEISDILNTKNTSFKLVNLFEDARIEHLFREKSKRPFNWMDSTEYGYINTSKYSAENIFYSFIKSEGVKENSPFYSLIYKDIEYKNKTQNEIDSTNQDFYKQFKFRENDYETVDGVKTKKFKSIYNEKIELPKNALPINFIGFEKADGMLQPIFECNNIFYNKGTPLSIFNTILLEHKIDHIKGVKHIISKYAHSYSWKKSKELEEGTRNTKFPHGSVTFDININGKLERITLLSYNGIAKPANPFLISCDEDYKKQGLKERFQIVYDYYNRVIKCPDTLKVIDIAEEWNKEFQNGDNDISNTSVKLLEYNPLTKEPMNIGEDIIDNSSSKYIKGVNLDGMEVDSFGESKYDGSIGPASKGGGLNHDNINKAREIRLLNSSNKFDYNKSNISEISKLFLNVLNNRFEKFNTFTPSKKINIKRLAVASQKFFIKKQDTLKGKDNIVLIVDCSASMRNIHIYNAKILILVLNALKNKGLITGNIVLTNNHGSLTCPLPVSEDIIREINCSGSEGFATTVRQVAPLLVEASKIFVFTDGCFGDIPDKDYKRRLGKSIYGLYVGEKDMSSVMKMYFDIAISKHSLLEIVNEIVKEIV